MSGCPLSFERWMGFRIGRIVVDGVQEATEGITGVYHGLEDDETKRNGKLQNKNWEF